MSASHPTSLRFERLLLTGAAGGLGRELRSRLKAYCATLRLSDVADLARPHPAKNCASRRSKTARRCCRCWKA